MTTKPPTLLVWAEALGEGLLSPSRLERLRTIATPLEAAPVAGFDDPRAAPHLAEVEVLVTHWGCPPLDEDALGRMPRLRAALHAAGSVKGHVTPACFDRGIRITTAAQANAIPVAEFTIAAIVLAGKRAFRAQRRYLELRAGRLWARELPGMGNRGKTIGIVGASRIGRMVIERLQAFDLDVLVHDPFLGEEASASLGATPCSLDELLRRSDVVSLHAPALPTTRHMLDRRRLGLMPDGAVLINTARGALVDHEALTDELVSGRIDAVLDTTEPEVLPADSPLYELDNVFLTPHIAGAQGRETRRLLDLALDELERLARGEPLQHEVHREDWDHIA